MTGTSRAGLGILTEQVLYEKAYDFIKEQEGEMLQAYCCSAGKVTIGVGITGKYEDGTPIKMGDTITDAQSRDLFMWYFKTRCLPTLPQNIQLTNGQKISLCSFIFNLGEGNWNSSTLKRKVISNPADTSIKDEFMKWIYYTNPKTGTKEVLRGLQLRREREANLYFTA